MKTNKGLGFAYLNNQEKRYQFRGMSQVKASNPIGESR
jgi:hypothetical protein